MSSTSPTMEAQTEFAIRMYDARADEYENSWHPDYSKRFVALVNPQPGQRVLACCCGTGLDAFLAADEVGNTGSVIGVDVSPGMLAKAQERLLSRGQPAQSVKFIRHDVSDLESCNQLEMGSFDVIMCSNAFVLLENPATVLRSWKRYLRPGGKMVIDITHENNMRSGTFIERAARRLQLPWPSNRLWIRSRDSFKEILHSEGLVVEQITELEKISGRGDVDIPVEDWEKQFDYVMSFPLLDSLTIARYKDHLRPLFREEFESEAVDGKVRVVDSLYVYVSRA